jgi:perosamine synthetase
MSNQAPISSAQGAFRIPLSLPDMSGNEEQYAIGAIRSSWISSREGGYIRRFEEEFASLCHSSACVTVATGTAALHLALLALGAQGGDEVLVPSWTYVATANAVRYVGARPVFVDVDERTWCMDPQLLAAKLTPRTKGIIAVHLYGHPADMDAINAFARRHSLWVIEDAAQAALATYKKRPVGGLATLGAFSFSWNKVLTSGEGGCLVVNDPAVEERLRNLKQQGRAGIKPYYSDGIGYNFGLTNVACAMLCAQLERRHQFLGRRREIFSRYRRLLAGLPGIELQPIAPWAEATPWLFSLRVHPERYGHSRDELIALLAEAGVEARPSFVPLPQLPGFAADPQEFPVSNTASSQCVSLPTFATLSDEDLDYVAAQLLLHCRSCRRRVVSI